MSNPEGIRGVIVEMYLDTGRIVSVNVDADLEEVELIEYQHDKELGWRQDPESGITLSLDDYRRMTRIVSKELGE